LKKTKILITGSTGFIGSAILAFLLKNKFNIYAILKNNKKRVSKSCKNYHLILYKNLSELEEKLKNYKFDVLINSATLYSNEDDAKTMLNTIEANISLFSIILKQTIKDINLIINFGSMMEHLRNKDNSYKNFYSITKSTMQNIINLFIHKKKIKFINIKLFESFGENDHRKKIVPTIMKNYKNNRITLIKTSNLSLNFVNITSIVEVIKNILLKNSLPSGNYCLRNHKFTMIKSLITSLNKVLKKKIKIKFFNKKLPKDYIINNNDIKNIYTNDNLRKFLLKNLNVNK
jgi:CDP-3, 6-dideoxy-D-glycero-L-glycero-4-hexulose-4-reductase